MSGGESRLCLRTRSRSLSPLVNRSYLLRMPTPQTRLRRAAAPVLALAAWTTALPIMGCYSYVPVANGTAPRPGDATLLLTAAGTMAVQQRLGENVREVDGTIVRVTTDSIEVMVSQVSTVTRERFPQNGASATIARAHIERVSERVFSKRRTWGLVIGVAAVIATALGATTAASASSDGPGGGGGIQP